MEAVRIRCRIGIVTHADEPASARIRLIWATQIENIASIPPCPSPVDINTLCPSIVTGHRALLRAPVAWPGLAVGVAVCAGHARRGASRRWSETYPRLLRPRLRQGRCRRILHAGCKSGPHASRHQNGQGEKDERIVEKGLLHDWGRPSDSTSDALLAPELLRQP